MVLKKLKKLKINKSDGPDGIHTRILKKTAEEICSPLATMCYGRLDQMVRQ